MVRRSGWTSSSPTALTDATIRYVPDMDMPDDAAFAITVEPAGGTDAPTGDVVAATA